MVAFVSLINIGMPAKGLVSVRLVAVWTLIAPAALLPMLTAPVPVPVLMLVVAVCEPVLMFTEPPPATALPPLRLILLLPVSAAVPMTTVCAAEVKLAVLEILTVREVLAEPLPMLVVAVALPRLSAPPVPVSSMPTVLPVASLSLIVKFPPVVLKLDVAEPAAVTLAPDKETLPVDLIVSVPDVSCHVDAAPPERLKAPFACTVVVPDAEPLVPIMMVVVPPDVAFVPILIACVPELSVVLPT